MRARVLALFAMMAMAAAPRALASQQPSSVRVGERQVEVVRLGSGSPTVVLESGGGLGLSAWSPVINDLAEHSRVIAYSRAGLGGSTGSAAASPAERVAELKELLDALDETERVVLVGWSYGGLLARLYVSTYPEDVAGLVLVDGTHESLFARMQPLFPSFNIIEGFGQMVESLPEDQRGDMVHVLKIQQQQHVPGMRPLPNLPLAVITAAKPCPPGREPICSDPRALAIGRELQSEWLAGSTAAMHIVSDVTEHNVMADQPELIVNAVRFVLRQVNARATRQ